MALAYAVVCAPVIGELIRVWPRFYPTGDDAVHAIHAHDVFSTRTPLLGMYSGISDPGKAFVYHLGPMVFWALAVPERVFSERLGIVIGAVIVDIVAAVALLRSVRRTAGAMAALGTAALVAITWWSIGRQVLAEPWNPYIAVVPLMLVLVYSLELANGALAPLPWTALAGSFVIQAHYLYIPVVLASIATGIALGVVARRQARSPVDEPPPPDRRGRRAVVAAGLVTLVCWSFPLYDEFAHWPGNFSRWIEALRHVQGVQLPASEAWHYVVRSIGWIPLAARGPLPGLTLFNLPFAVGALATIVALAVMAMLVATVVAFWKRDPRVARFAVIAAVLVPVTWFGVWRLPLSLPVIPVYRIVALWPVGAYVWAAAIVGALVLLGRTDVARGMRVRASTNAIALRRVAVVVVVCAAVGSAIVGVAGAQSDRPVDRTDWASTKALVGPTLQRLPHDARYRMRADGGLAFFVQYGIMRALLDHGYRAFVPTNDVQLSRDYGSNDPHDSTLLVTTKGGPLPRGERLIALYEKSTAKQRTLLGQARAAAVAALQHEPLRLTSRGEQERRQASGLARVYLDEVQAGTVTPEHILDSFLDHMVVDSRRNPSGSARTLVVGSDVLPALTAYSRLRHAVNTFLMRVVLIRPS